MKSPRLWRFGRSWHCTNAWRPSSIKVSVTTCNRRWARRRPLTFQSLLKDFSVAQVYNIVWSAARDAAAYCQRGGINKQQAANSMVGGCRTRGDKARVKGWQVKPYGRNHNRPRSELSHVLHDVFLKIGELGFTHKPSRDAL